METDLMRPTMEEEGWQLQIKAADSAKKLPIELIQWPTRGELQLVPSTEPMGVQEKSEKPGEQTHWGISGNISGAEGKKETGAPILPNQSSAREGETI